MPFYRTIHLFVLNKRDVLRKTPAFLIIIYFPGFFRVLIFHMITVFHTQ